MARERGRPAELPEELVYLRLAVTPEEHRQIKVAAALAGLSMAQFARRSVAEAARAKATSAGLDPARLPQAETAPGGGATDASAEGEAGGTNKGRRGRKKPGA